jgi:hypothetical protein
VQTPAVDFLSHLWKKGVLPVSEGASLRADAVKRYLEAQRRADLAREEWIAADRPFTVTHANHVQGLHPAYRALEQAEAHADKMARALRRSTWFVPKIELGGDDDLSEFLRSVTPIARPASARVRDRGNGQPD